MHPLVTLLGDEHHDLGAMHVETLGDHTAIALSAGYFPKPYWHLDANEDGVLAMDTARCRVLVVADGHNGFDAAKAALNGVFEATELAPIEEAPPDLIVRCNVAAKERVTRVLDGADDEQRILSRTALSIAVVAPDRLYACTYGDTVVTRVRGQRLKQLSGDASFLAPHSVLAAVSVAPLRTGDVIILASDGVTDFLGRTWKDRFTQAASSADPRKIAQGLVELAFAGGAGDHLSIAVTVA